MSNIWVYPISLTSFNYSCRYWAIDVEAGTSSTGFESNGCGSLFSVSVDLTDLGFEHKFEVCLYLLV